MQPFVANADIDWFDFLSQKMTGGPLDEVNFWQPRSTRPMKRMVPGEPVFLRLKQPNRAIAGHGYFAHFSTLSIEMAWELFGWRNGAESESAFLRRLSKYRREDFADPRQRQKKIGCTVLREVVLWPDHQWMPWAANRGWHSNIVQGRTETGVNAIDLLASLESRPEATIPADLLADFVPLSTDERSFTKRPVADRPGQNTFKARLWTAYKGCAITGERSWPVLDAAHIQPYWGPASNHIQNGLLLTKDWHALFDKGYATITPDLQIRVSAQLRETWQDAHRYHHFDGKPLALVPKDVRQRPSRDALAWHMERFRG